MRNGLLEVLLIGAKGLENADFLSMLNHINMCVCESFIYVFLEYIIIILFFFILWSAKI